MAKLFKKSKPPSTSIISSSISTGPSTESTLWSLNSSTTNFVTPRATANLRSFQSSQSEKRVSNTMQMALASTSSTSRSVLVSASSPDLHTSTNIKSSNVYPRSESKQYWAARALTAETLLAAKTKHYEDLQTVTISQETKRVTEVAQLTNSYDKRLVKMEKLLVFFLGVFLLLILSGLFSHLSLIHRGQKEAKGRGPWAHFTIPILSPFASVVEHEVSVVGSKTIFGLCLIIAGLAYILLRHWANSRNRP